MKTQLFASELVQDAATLIKKGGLVVFPTETVYGLGASAFNPGACARIFSAKGRPSDNPLIVHVASQEQLELVAGPIPAPAKLLMDAFWPGPLSLVIPKNPSLPEIVTAGLANVAVRWPASALAQSFLLACGVPVAAPSANVSGAPSPTNFEMAKGAMLGRVEGILIGEDCQEGLESTVVGFVDGQAKIFRPGSVTAEDLARVLNVAIESLVYETPTEGRPLSPGMKYTHYKPHAEVRLFTDPSECLDEEDADNKVGVVLMGQEAPDSFPASWEVFRFDDWKAYGRHLYSSFFEFDRIGCSIIFAQLPSEQGLGLAIANRLKKAAGSGPLR